jgi:hypothetical protein
MIERGGSPGGCREPRFAQGAGNVSHDEKPVKMIANLDRRACKFYNLVPWPPHLENSPWGGLPWCDPSPRMFESPPSRRSRLVRKGMSDLPGCGLTGDLAADCLAVWLWRGGCGGTGCDSRTATG